MSGWIDDILSAALHRMDPADKNAFRVDHVLGMPAIAALSSLLAAVPPVPADARLGKVSILWEETLALEGRAGFYDRAGASGTCCRITCCKYFA